MALFRRRGHIQSSLLTAVISAGWDVHEGEWEVIWIGEGGRVWFQEPEKVPARMVATSLSEATDWATTAALVLFVEGRMTPDAELQFAIYPWDYGKDAPIYDVTLSEDGFTAREMSDDDDDAPVISAPTLEMLVEEMRGQPGGDAAMLRWIRPFADLPTAALE